MQEPFGGETFSYSLFLVLCNRVCTCSVALFMLLVRWLVPELTPQLLPRILVHAMHTCF